MIGNSEGETNPVDMPKEDRPFKNEEWAEIQKYVEVVTSTIREIESPVITTSNQLPPATAHLNDLAKR